MVVEDAAQAFLSKSKDNRYAGTKYEIGCFSFSITKLISMIYGGFCVTNSIKLAEKLYAIRNNGVSALPEYAKQELPSMPGLNLKASSLHAKIGLINLKRRNEIIFRLKKISSIYKKILKNNNNIKLLESEVESTIPNYILVTVKKKKFLAFCKRNGINIHFHLRCLHESKSLSFKKNSFPNASFISKNVIRLPCGPGYSEKDILTISNLIKKFK